jgi:hypothetical protein
MGRDATYPLDLDTKRNATELLEKVNRLIAYAPLEMVFRVSSGWRPKELNAKVPNASKTSHHITGNAIDFHDPHGHIDNWCLANLDRLEECGLYLEDPAHTKNWSHLQQIAPRSGRRVFLP